MGPSDTSAAPDAGTGDDMSKGFVIEIECKADGTFSVSSEPLQDEAAEENGEAAEPAGKPIASFKDAIMAAVEIYKNQGANPSDEDSQLAAGYNSATGTSPDTVSSAAPTDMASRG